MQKITSELDKVYSNCVEKYLELTRLVQDNLNKQSELSIRSISMDKRSEELDSREAIVKASEVVCMSIGNINKKERELAIEEERLHSVKTSNEMANNVARADIAAMKSDLENRLAELKQASIDLLNAQKQFKIDRENMKQDILASFGKK